jgi:hypothetical protein
LHALLGALKKLILEAIVSQHDYYETS